MMEAIVVVGVQAETVILFLNNKLRIEESVMLEEAEKCSKKNFEEVGETEEFADEEFEANISAISSIVEAKLFLVAEEEEEEATILSA